MEWWIGEGAWPAIGAAALPTMRRLGAMAAAPLLSACFTTAMAHQHEPAPTVPAPRACRASAPRVVDLSQALRPDMAIGPGGVPFSKTVLVDHDQGYRSHKLELGENTGTHVDAPLHFLPEGGAIDRIRTTQLVSPAVVIDVSKRARDDADFSIGPDVLVDWEAAHGPIPVQAIVLFHTGWSERLDQPRAYANADAEGVLHFPGLGAEAAQLLVERDVVAVGIDTLSIDPGPSQDFAAHRALLGFGAFLIENLTRLDELPPVGATVVVGVLPIVEGTQAPARVLALVPDPPPGEEPTP